MQWGPVFGGGGGVADLGDNAPADSSASRACSKGRRPGPASPRSSATSPVPPPMTRRSAAGPCRASRRPRWPDIGVGVVVAGPAWEVPRRGGHSSPTRASTCSASSSTAGAWPRSPRTARARERQASAGVRFCPLPAHRRLAARSGCSRRPGSHSMRWSGSWTTQSVFQLVREPSARFADQVLMGGFEPDQVSIGLGVALLVFFAGLIYWGNRFKRFRRTSIIVIGIGGGLAMMAAIFALNHSAGWAGGPGAARPRLLGGLFVLAGATPGGARPARRHQRVAPGRSRRDHGPLLGLPGGRPDRGRAGRAAARRNGSGIDGLLLASLGLLAVAHPAGSRPARSASTWSAGGATTTRHRASLAVGGQRRLTASGPVSFTASCASRSSSSPPCATTRPTPRWSATGCWSAPATSASSERASTRCCRSASA